MEVTMNGKRLAKWTLILAVAALGLAPVLAQPAGGPGGRRHGPGGGPGMRMGHLAQALDLSDDQRSKIRVITAKYIGGALGDHMDALRQAHHKLDGFVQDPAATDAQVQEAANAVSARALLVAVDRHHMAVEISAVLTPDQRQKAAELRQKRPAGPPGFEADEPGPDAF